MNILILNWRDPKNPDSGGAEIVTFMHAKAWVRKGHSVIWFASRFEGASKKEKIDGIDIVRQGNILTVYLLGSFFYLFAKQKFDLVIDEIHGLPFLTPLYVRKPKIALIHEVAEEIWDYMYPFPINKIGRLIESFYFNIYKNVKFWTDADSTINDLVKYGIKRENCIAIPCPITSKILDNLPQKEESPTFIFVSRLVRMKGIEDIIEAFSLITKEEKKAKLWVVGEGEKSYVHRLKKMAKNLGVYEKATFFGEVSDDKKLELMQKAHLLLHASVKEGWGLVITEAASQATPSVVYNVSGLRNSVKNGETGVVLTKNSPLGLANAALLLVRDEEMYVKFQRNCLKWARSLKQQDVTSFSLKLIEKISKS